MALVCPAGHPPGVGTKFCRLCGRDYVEEPNPLLESLAPPLTEDVIPVQAPSVEAAVTVPAAPWPPAPLPVVSGPPAQAAPAPAPAPVASAPASPSPAPAAAAPVATAPPRYELIPVPATGGVQVHLPLAELPDLSAASELDAELAPEPGKPAPTDTHALDLGGPVLTAHEEEPAAEEAKPVRALDRTAVLAGALAGFVGGAVSGAAVTLFLS